MFIIKKLRKLLGKNDNRKVKGMPSLSESAEEAKEELKTDFVYSKLQLESRDPDLHHITENTETCLLTDRDPDLHHITENTENCLLTDRDPDLHHITENTETCLLTDIAIEEEKVIIPNNNKLSGEQLQFSKVGDEIKELDNNNEIPSILVDAKLLEEFSDFHIQRINTRHSFKQYVIDGDLFHEENLLNDLREDDNVLLEYKIEEITRKDNSNLIEKPKNNTKDSKDQSNDCFNDVNERVDDESSGIVDESYNSFDESSTHFNFDTDKRQDNKSEFSYADVAKKPNPYPIPAYKEFKFGERWAKVQFDSWHMVTVQKKKNSFYCMACKESMHIKHKTQHCLDVNHVENLMKCTIITDFKEHFVRKVTDKLYHCGHCNNLQIYDEMQHHIDTVHMKNISAKDSNVSTLKAKNISASSKTDSNFNKTIRKDIGNETKAIDNNIQRDKSSPSPILYSADAEISPGNKGNINNAHFNANVENANRQALNFRAFSNIPTEADTIVIQEFGRSFRVSLLSFHFMERRPNCYDCLLCRVICPNNFIWHHLFNDVNHALRIRETPFYVKYNDQLIRNTANGFHCLVCNVFMKFDPVIHFKEPMHHFLINRAFIQTVQPSLRDQENVETSRLNQSEIGKQINEGQNRLNTRTTNYDNVTECEVKVSSLNQADKGELINKQQKVLNSNTETHNLTQSKVKVNHTRSETGMQANEPDKTPNNQTTYKDNGIKKNQCKNIDIANIDTIESKMELITETSKAFDFEEFLYVKIRNFYVKITLAAYNSLVATGSGSRYCFLCSVEVFYGDLTDHVKSQNHLRNLKTNNFVLNYEQHCLRQISSTYHCALCNVIITKKYIRVHFLWGPHTERLAHKIVKNTRRNEIKSGIKEILCSTQPEILGDVEKDTWNILAHFECSKQQDNNLVKKNKIIKLNDIVLKISWDMYHGICENKIGFKCLICQLICKNYELGTHVKTPRHVGMLDKCFQREFIPALIRKVNDTTSHCLTCNAQVPNTAHLINSHVAGKKHHKMYNEVIIQSSSIDSNGQDVLILTPSHPDKRIHHRNQLR